MCFWGNDSSLAVVYNITPKKEKVKRASQKITSGAELIHPSFRILDPGSQPRQRHIRPNRLLSPVAYTWHATHTPPPSCGDIWRMESHGGELVSERLGEVESEDWLVGETLRDKQHFRVQHACLIRSLALAAPLGKAVDDRLSAASLVPTGTLHIRLSRVGLFWYTSWATIP